MEFLKQFLKFKGIWFKGEFRDESPTFSDKSILSKGYGFAAYSLIDEAEIEELLIIKEKVRPVTSSFAYSIDNYDNVDDFNIDKLTVKWASVIYTFKNNEPKCTLLLLNVALEGFTEQEILKLFDDDICALSYYAEEFDFFENMHFED